MPTSNQTEHDTHLDPPDLPDEDGEPEYCDECGRRFPCRCVQAERELEREWQE